MKKLSLPYVTIYDTAVKNVASLESFGGSRKDETSV